MSNDTELNIELIIMTKYKEECINNFLVLLDYVDREFPNFPIEIIKLINQFYGHDTPISYTPFFCQLPGRYSLVKDIHIDSIESGIHVIRNNISINLNKFTLKLIHNDTIGISANNISNLLIHNGCIKAKKSIKDSNARGLFVKNCKNICVSGILFKNFKEVINNQ